MLDIITWVTLMFAWCSILYRRYKVRKGDLKGDKAYKWAEYNVIISIIALLLALFNITMFFMK